MRTGLTRTVVAAAMMMAGLIASQASAQTSPVAAAIETATQAILGDAKAMKAFDDIKADDDRAFAEQKRITEIPAPPYKEKVRAEYYLKRFQELGFKDAAIDSE